MLAFSVSSLVVLVSLAVPAVSLTNNSIPHIPYFHTIPPQPSTWQELATSHIYIPLILLASVLGRSIGSSVSTFRIWHSDSILKSFRMREDLVGTEGAPPASSHLGIFSVNASCWSRDGEMAPKFGPLTAEHPGSQLYVGSKQAVRPFIYTELGSHTDSYQVPSNMVVEFFSSDQGNNNSFISLLGEEIFRPHYPIRDKCGLYANTSAKPASPIPKQICDAPLFNVTQEWENLLSISPNELSAGFPVALSEKFHLFQLFELTRTTLHNIEGSSPSIRIILWKRIPLAWENYGLKRS
ncbi:hypothetical protein DFH08DRAFT_823493 [Mycena albidolilacea]|uniref:Uncharacterized protein n=1 Tax=Mycena albidolilacea TaxID=1033008 RepID=A0AAD7EBA1_9AGAR|nr:hypothetical protein DFH08DRAFT_823493 [Mycena albidolilacea]